MTVELVLLLVSIVLTYLSILIPILYYYTGSYGNFEIMPLLCPGGFNSCTTTLAARERLRKPNSDGMSSIQYTFVNI